MADNYLERKMEAYRERQAKEEKARKLLWRRRLDAYRKKLAEEAAGAEGADGAAGRSGSPVDVKDIVIK